MKKLALSLALLLAFAVPVVARNHENRGPANNVDICHYSEEEDTYHLMNVNENALEAHLEHGDGLPGEEGQFDENCNFEGGPFIPDPEDNLD